MDVYNHLSVCAVFRTEPSRINVYPFDDLGTNGGNEAHKVVRIADW